MHSSLPQQLTNFRFSESYLLIRIFAALERSALAHSEAVITICPTSTTTPAPRACRRSGCS
jgi:hypothetical protein